MDIHPTAIIHQDAQLGKNVTIGPFCVIGPNVVIGAGTRLDSHVVIECNTRLGQDNHIYAHAVLGGDAQDLRSDGALAYAVIGDRNQFHEFATVNRGSHGERITRVGSDCLMMAGSHVAHDCQVGNGVIISNYGQLGGHVIVEDRAVIGGMAAFHQFCRVGTMAMIGGTAGIMQDCPPYCMVQGAPPATVRTLNSIGMERNGVPPDSLKAMKQVFRLMFRRGMNRENALAEIEASVDMTPEVRHFVEWYKAPSKRGICKPETKAAPAFKVVEGSAEPSASRNDSRESAANGG